jgi:hypothetical protein
MLSKNPIHDWTNEILFPFLTCEARIKLVIINKQPRLQPLVLVLALGFAITAGNTCFEIKFKKSQAAKIPA